MKEIKLDLDIAEKSITRYKEIIENLKKICERLKSENTALRSRWNGKSSNKFGNYCEIIEKNLSGRINELEKICNGLNEAKNTFIEEDKNILK